MIDAYACDEMAGSATIQWIVFMLMLRFVTLRPFCL